MEFVLKYKGERLGVLLPMEMRFVINFDYKGVMPKSLENVKTLNVFDIDTICSFYRELLMTEENDLACMIMDMEEMLESGKINNKDYIICEE